MVIIYPTPLHPLAVRKVYQTARRTHISPGWKEALWNLSVLPENTAQWPGQGSNPGANLLVFFKCRYKQKYTWAQLPWIQIGVKYNSLTLLMDIVTMKLPANALIFLAALEVEFNVNFLSRCRVNALSGEQVSQISVSYDLRPLRTTMSPKILRSNLDVVPIISDHQTTRHEKVPNILGFFRRSTKIQRLSTKCIREYQGTSSMYFRCQV